MVQIELNRIKRFFTSGFLASIINGKFIQVLLPAFAGAYFLTLDVWGSDLWFIKNHTPIHKIIFAWLLVITLLSQIFKAISDGLMSKIQGEYARFLEDFMLLTGRVVEFKLSRFRKIARNIKPNGDAFKAITQPNDQVTYIIDQSLAWIRQSFDLNEEQLSITIIQIRDGGSKAFYAFEEPQGWNRTKAKSIMSSDSAASLCASSGEPIFYADKKRAAKNSKYHMSSRDNERKIGSIYCYPTVVELPGKTEKFIISITTYGKLLCQPSDDEASGIAQSILRELCRRIELELTLRAVRQWKFGEQ